MSRRRTTAAVLVALVLLPLGVAATAPSPPPPATDPGPWLVFDFALGWGMGPVGGERPGGVRFEVQAATPDGPFKCLYRAIYLRRQWYPYAVHLGNFAGQQVRIRLLVEHVEGRIMLDYPHWGNPRIVVGPLTDSALQQTTARLAMLPMDLAGALLADGTVKPLIEDDPIFSAGLVTPGRLDRDLMLLVYAGDNHICVPGKQQPGVYMGVSMSVDYLRIGAGPDGRAWTGTMPPPVFGQWTVAVPPRPTAAAIGDTDAPRQAPTTTTKNRDMAVIQQRLDTHPYRPGLVATIDWAAAALRVGMGPETDLGWAFAGIEVVGLTDPDLALQRGGRHEALGDNSFSGVVVDYHTPRGYSQRTFFGLGVGGPERYDLRPADWILDGPPLSLQRTLAQHCSYVELGAPEGPGPVRVHLPLTANAPADWDGRVWLAAGVQDLPRDASLEVVLPARKGVLAGAVSPADEELGLEDYVARFTLSGRTGALTSGWHALRDRQVLEPAYDRYTLETLLDRTQVTEQLDQVESVDTSFADGKKTIVFTCGNRAMPGVTIHKRYWLAGPGLLRKRVAFTTSDTEGFFIRYEADTHLASPFMAVSSRAGELAETMVVSNGRMVTKTEQVTLENFSAGDAPMAIATDYSSAVASYRFKVNDRFVLQGPANGTASGWHNMVFVDYLKAGEQVSGEIGWLVFAGDFTAFDRHYQALPEYQALWTYRSPAWVADVIADAMYIGPQDTFPFYRTAAPDLVTATIWFLNPPWGNWAADSDPPRSLHPDVHGIAAGWRTTFPNSRVSSYTTMFFDDESDIFRDHPGFGVADPDGNLITSGIASDHGGRPTFYYQLLDPECRAYLLDMHVGKFKGWDLDFFYMDGPGSSNEIVDWGHRDVTQSYDWLDFSRELRERLQAVKPDVAWFVNGERMPYTDIGYIEWRDEGWQSLASAEWHGLAITLLRMKINQIPGHLIIPTYGSPAADPALSAYTILYGWGGSLSEVGRLPWMREALQYRDLELVESAVTPRWWRTDVDFEAYGFRHGDGAVISVLDHAAAPRQVTVHARAAELGLHPGTPLYGDLLLMNDTASSLQPDPADPAHQIRVWANTQAVTRTPRFTGEPCPEVLDLVLPTTPMLLTRVVLAHQPPDGK